MSAPLRLRQLDAKAPGFEREFAALIAFEAAQDPAVDAAVATIVADVRARGDAALLEYTGRFDRMAVASAAALEIKPAEMHAAFDGASCGPARRARDGRGAHPRLPRPAEDWSRGPIAKPTAASWVRR